MQISYSFIIPVYNRPDEVDELLNSLAKQNFDREFEIVIVEDGSSNSSEGVVKKYSDQLSISYFFKENSGPGDSRNYGMQRAKGDYFLILDSDCVLPPQYLREVDDSLSKGFVHCFGGPDAAHSSFTSLQKAINYSMTSWLTTGGIRGKANAVTRFQPRSFNMGISKEAFTKTGGFGNIHPGEDPDLTIRIWQEGYDTRLVPRAFVYHKRRISWRKFYRQVHKFGMVRPILNSWHPHTAKLAYWFPLLFVLGLMASIVLAFFDFWYFLSAYGFYFFILLLDSVVKNGNIKVAFLSLVAVLIQFFGYGFGFLKTTVAVGLFDRNPEKVFPGLFFKN